MSTLAAVLWLALPVTLGGFTHVIAIKKDVLPSLAQVRLDGGATVRGKPLFGENKTLRGAIVMIAATIFWTIVVDAFEPEARYVPESVLSSWALGSLLGLGYILGELPNSFLKRQLGIAPGEPAPGQLAPALWVADQVDSALGLLLLLSLWKVPTLGFVVLLLSVTLVIHPVVAAIMVALGLKRRVG